MTQDNQQREAMVLKPCPNPLCDLSRPHIEHSEGLNGRTWVACENCGASGKRIDNPSEYYGRTAEYEQVDALAIAAWNTRAATPPPPDAREGLIAKARTVHRDWLRSYKGVRLDHATSVLAEYGKKALDLLPQLVDILAADTLASSPVGGEVEAICAAIEAARDGVCARPRHRGKRTLSNEFCLGVREGLKRAAALARPAAKEPGR